MRAVERDNLGSCDIFPGLGAPHFTVGGGGGVPWGERPGLTGKVFAEYVSGSAWPSAEGATLLPFHSPAHSSSVDNEKWHLHKVERKSIVSITHYALHCSGDNISSPIKRIISITYCAWQKSCNVSLKELSPHDKTHFVSFPTPWQDSPCL